MKSDGGISKLLGEYSLEHKMLLIYEKSEKFRVLTDINLYMENTLLEQSQDYCLLCL